MDQKNILFHLLKKKYFKYGYTLSFFMLYKKNSFDRPNENIIKINLWLNLMNKKFFIKYKKIMLVK